MAFAVSASITIGGNRTPRVFRKALSLVNRLTSRAAVGQRGRRGLARQPRVRHQRYKACLPMLDDGAAWFRLGYAML
jgi:hypothetical protein